MPDAKNDAPKEFLVVALPDDATPGATVRLLAIAGTATAARNEIDKLDSGTLGRVAVLERKALIVRRPAVENVEVTDPISKSKK